MFLADAKNFIAAESLCAQAIKIMGDGSFCIQEDATASLLPDSLQWPAAWQGMMMKADSLAFAGTVVKALELINLAGEIFIQHKLRGLKLQHPPIVEFATSKHNLEIYSQTIFL